MGSPKTTYKIKTIAWEFQGEIFQIPAADYISIAKFAEALFGLTPSDSEKKAAAAWAVNKAIALLPVLTMEAYEL